MNKKIELTYDDVDYTLEYNRESITYMEKQGLNISEITTKPATMLIILWRGAFIKNHKKTKIETIDEIYDNIQGKEDLNGALSEMVFEAYEALMGDNKEDTSKKIVWKMS